MTYVMHVRHLSGLSDGDAIRAQHPRLVREVSTGQDQVTGPTRELMARGSFWLRLPLQGFAIGHLVDQPIQPVVPILLADGSVALFLLDVLQALDPASPSGSHGVTLQSGATLTLTAEVALGRGQRTRERRDHRQWFGTAYPERERS